MGTSTAGPGPSPQDLNDAYSELLNDLNAAFFAAADPNDKAELNDLIVMVTDVITGLNAADFSTRDAAFNALGAQVKTVNSRLQTLQAQVNRIIGIISTAAKVVAAINEVVNLAAKVF
jgi:sulfur transfer protein SufE